MANMSNLAFDKAANKKSLGMGERGHDETSVPPAMAGQCRLGVVLDISHCNPEIGEIESLVLGRIPVQRLRSVA